MISINKPVKENSTWNDLCVNGPSLEEINSSVIFKYEKSEMNMWFDSLPKQEKGIMLVLHGLNLKPSKMNSLSHFWSSQGYSVLRGTLSGHFGSEEEMKAVTQLTWRRNVSNLICHAWKRASNANLPLYFLGYSLGAASMIDTLKSQGLPNPFEKMILLAPAIRVKWYANLTKIVSFFSGKIMIPSGNLKDYRSQNGTATAAYSSLHQIIDTIEAPYTSMNVPTWIYLDPDDELISKSGLQELVDHKDLNLWSLKLINKSKTSLDKNYHHLIIDPPTLGAESFNQMSADMKSFIESPSIK